MAAGALSKYADISSPEEGYHMAHKSKIQIDQYGPDLPKILRGKEQVSKSRGKVFEGTEQDERLAPQARSYVPSKSGGRHEKNR